MSPQAHCKLHDSGEISPVQASGFRQLFPGSAGVRAGVMSDHVFRGGSGQQHGFHISPIRSRIFTFNVSAMIFIVRSVMLCFPVSIRYRCTRSSPAIRANSSWFHPRSSRSFRTVSPTCSSTSSNYPSVRDIGRGSVLLKSNTSTADPTQVHRSENWADNGPLLFTDREIRRGVGILNGDRSRNREGADLGLPERKFTRR